MLQFQAAENSLLYVIVWVYIGILKTLLASQVENTSHLIYVSLGLGLQCFVANKHPDISKERLDMSSMFACVCIQVILGVFSAH